MSNVVKLVPKDNADITYVVRQIPIERIRAFDFQPRKWFDAEEITARAESMKELGQQDPVTVEPIFNDPKHDYELINGESRLRSAREAGIAMLWAAVRSQPFASKIEKHLASLVANFNRSDHTSIEISDALHVQITQGGKTQISVARALGKSISWVTLHLSLQKLHPDVRALMNPARPKVERLATATAVELARLPYSEQLEILRKATLNGKTIVSRVKIRMLKKVGEFNVQLNTWSIEREERYRELNNPNPDHVKHLRAGIAEFRALLKNRRWTSA